ncbi:hypothetical protein ACSZMW_07285 [Aeromonas allosaccharophila]
MLDASVTLWSTPLPATTHLLLWQGGTHGYREQAVLQPIATLLAELNGRPSTTLDVGLAGLCQRLTWLAADHQTLLEPAGLREMTDVLIRAVPADGTGCVALDITPFRWKTRRNGLRCATASSRCKTSSTNCLCSVIDQPQTVQSRHCGYWLRQSSIHWPRRC